MKFINLSPHEDFYLKFQSDLHILMQNVLYLTHEIDQIKKIVKELKNTNSLQKQVDDYFVDPHGTGEAHLGTDPDYPQE